ncbi:MAG: hypothetical protein FJ271_33060 [Planctomycetes bacterium]|nr:hypothetical protein [Planctomycetota bacterium]
MGLFARLSDMVSANRHALLDTVEDPEKMLSQVLREMEEGLTAARLQAARAIAAERRLERELVEHRLRGHGGQRTGQDPSRPGESATAPCAGRRRRQGDRPDGHVFSETGFPG